MLRYQPRHAAESTYLLANIIGGGTRGADVACAEDPTGIRKVLRHGMLLSLSHGNEHPQRRANREDAKRRIGNNGIARIIALYSLANG